MSWCGICGSSQTESDFDSDDDGEYEYFVNSNYICKRKKTSVSRDGISMLPGKNESMTESTTKSESHASDSSSLDPSSSLQRSRKGRPDDTSQTSSFETDKKSSISSAQLAGARIWQVGVATISGTDSPYDPFAKPIQSLYAPSTSGSDKRTEIIFKKSRKDDCSKLQQDMTVNNKIVTPNLTTSSRISSGDTSKIRREPGFIQRLFGRSGKSVFRRESGSGASPPLSFKESMEQPSPTIATNTLYWTVRVKMK